MLNAAQRLIADRNPHPFVVGTLKTFAVIFGALIVAFGLEQFLIPNGFLDGGVVGVSIILANFIQLPVGVFIAVLNIPFLFIAYKHAGWTTTFRTALGVATLAFATILFHYIPPLTSEFFLALGYGGVLVGAGVGIALRFGGALDGTEILAVFLANRTRFGVDQIILIINAVIFIIAAFVLSPEQAMASFLLFYIVVTRIIKYVMQGGNEAQIIQILSTKHQEVSDAIHAALNRKVTFIDAHKDDINDTLKIVMTYCARFEEARLVEAVEAVDPEALIIVTDAANLHGSIFTENKHH